MLNLKAGMFFTNFHIEKCKVSERSFVSLVMVCGRGWKEKSKRDNVVGLSRFSMLH